MSPELQAVQKMKSRLARLGTPKWKDPERRQSIKDSSRAKMGWQLRSSLWTMTCWVALHPAKPCLKDAIRKIEDLIRKRECDIWDGERTSRGCTWDGSMYGRTVRDAQPTIIISSSSKPFLRNAKRIIGEENIQVDPRGIGIEYYENGPVLFQASGRPDPMDLEAGLQSLFSLTDPVIGEKGGKSSEILPTYPHANENRESSSSHVPKPAINGASVIVGQATCTMGGVLLVNGELFGLTVAHAFEHDPERNSENQVEPVETSPTTIHSRTLGTIGLLHEKRQLQSHSKPSSGDLDWALCKIDRARIHLSNNVLLADGNILCPRNIAQADPTDMAVAVHTGPTGVVSGSILGNYSLVALPGSKTFQRMWIVILDRLVQRGDCGSWVLNPASGEWLGHIIAGKLGTNVAYIVLARDIVNEISSRFGDQAVRLPCATELEVSDTVSEIKRAIQLPEPQQVDTHTLTPESDTAIGSTASSSTPPRISVLPSIFGSLRMPRRIKSEENLPRENSRTRVKFFEEETVDASPNGWPRLAAYLNSEDDLAIFRSFKLLHLRQLTILQTEMTKLESRLKELDLRDEANPEMNYRLSTTQNEEGWDEERKMLQDQIQVKLLIYGT